MVDDVAQLRQQLAQRVAIAGRREIAVDGVEEPQRRVGGVVQPCRSRPRETCSESGRRARSGRTCAGSSAASLRAPGRKRQPFQADHGVAAPVGEPVIAGDHLFALRSPGRPRAWHPRDAPPATRETDPPRSRAPRESPIASVRRLIEAMARGAHFAFQRPGSGLRLHQSPAIQSPRDRRVSLDAIAEFDVEITWAPQRALVLVSSAFTASAARARTGDASARPVPAIATSSARFSACPPPPPTSRARRGADSSRARRASPT